MFNNIKIDEAVAIVGVISALLTALVSLASLRWSSQALNAKDAQIDALKQRLDSLNERTPAELHTQVVALKAMLEGEITQLRTDLNESNARLRTKSEEVNVEKRNVAVMLGFGRHFFGIDDAELLVRRLFGLLYARHGMPIEYGEQELAIWGFYVHAIQLLIPNEQTAEKIVSGNPEWMWDYLMKPILSAMRFKSLKFVARESYEAICGAMEKTAFRREVPFYRACLERVMAGYDFFREDTPPDLQIMFMELASSRH